MASGRPHKQFTELFDPRQGDSALRVRPLQWPAKVIEPPRTNFFTIYWMAEGRGRFFVDSASYQFTAECLLFLVPYQRARFAPDTPVTGDVIEFHANFLCVETFHAEVGCSGVLFNTAQGAPVLPIDPATRTDMEHLLNRMRTEQATRDLASDEALLAYMKVLLILATRAKLRTSADPHASTAPVDARQPTINTLTQLIEDHYCRLHTPADYAELMHMTPKTLGRIVKEHLGKTLTDLIRDRILTHAKWQLLHTLRPVKEVAREVGFQDELYFSRLFKKATGVSPTFFREYETEIRGGRNLSMD